MELRYLHKKGLEQASSELVARARAQRVASIASGATWLDATCSIGADALAVALAGLRVSCADLDPESLSYARANLAHHGRSACFVRADATRPAVKAELYYVDPDRRKDGRRSLDPRAWSPSLEACMKTAGRFAGACLKLAPGLAPESLLDAEQAVLDATLARRREWISRAGELAEICLWMGSLGDEGAAPDRRVATLLTHEGARHEFAGEPISRAALTPQEAQAAEYLADPDPAIVRAGLLGRLARSEELAPLAPKLGYLGGSHPSKSPFLRVFRVLDSVALDRKKVRKMLRAHDVGAISVRKRGHPEAAEVLASRLRGDGSRRGELLVARLDSGHRAYLVEPV